MGATVRGVYHRPGADSAVVEVRWDTARHSLLVRDGDTETAVRAPDLTLDAGGWRGSAVHFTWRDGETTASVTFDDPEGIEALTRDLPLDLAEQVRAHRAASMRGNRKSKLGLGLVLALVLAPVLALGTLIIYPDPVLDMAVAALPTSIDDTLASHVEEQVVAAGTVDDPTLVGAVETIGERLLAAAPDHPYDFRFYVVRDETLNAFAAPGGIVVVHTGLLAAAETPEEVAGVLAHEIAHVLERHSTRQIVYQVGLWSGIALLFGSPDTAAQLLVGLGSDLAKLSFGRDQERDADAVGLELLVRAQVEPRGMVTFFERLAGQDPDIPTFLSTHPGSEGRAERIASEIDALGDGNAVPFAIHWDAVREAAR